MGALRFRRFLGAFRDLGFRRVSYKSLEVWGLGFFGWDFGDVGFRVLGGLLLGVWGEGSGVLGIRECGGVGGQRS